MIFEKVFNPDFFVHSLSYENSRVVDENTSFSSILQFNGKIKQERMTNSDDSKGKIKEPPLPSLKYLLSNPLVTGKFNFKDTDEKELAEETMSSESGLLLPKFLIITHKLNPISVGDFIESLSGCIKRMYDIQKEQFHNLKRNIPHYHVISGFTLEGVIALSEDRESTVFVPFAGNRVHFNEDMFFRLVDGLSDTTSDDLLDTQVVAWLESVMLSYFKDSQMRKFHFFAFVQTHGKKPILKIDTSSSFDSNHSPLEQLSLELGFHRTSKL